jgi:hypothetical protein
MGSQAWRLTVCPVYVLEVVKRYFVGPSLNIDNVLLSAFIARLRSFLVPWLIQRVAVRQREMTLLCQVQAPSRY